MSTANVVPKVEATERVIRELYFLPRRALNALSPQRYFVAMRVLVLGAGFGGLELTTRLPNEFGDDTEILLIDSSDGFVFGFSKLDVMFERLAPAA
jgi:hypothetical protein